VVVLAGLVVGPAGPAWAQARAPHASGVAAASPPSIEACVGAYENGQRERLAGQLRAARASFVTCSQEACPRAARVDCASWLDEVERLVPSLVFSVKDPDGNDAREPTLTLDGQPVELRGDGRAIVVDPGTHLVRIAARGLAPKETRLVVVEGEKARLVRLDLAREGEPASASPSSSSASAARVSPPLAPATGGADRGWSQPVTVAVAGVSLAGFAAVGLWGLAGKADLDDCKPRCSRDAVQRVHTRFVVADSLLAVGIVAGGIAAVRALTSPKVSPSPATSADRAPRTGLEIGLSPRGEAAFSWSGRF
jgi:hypothetical protein